MRRRAYVATVLAGVVPGCGGLPGFGSGTSTTSASETTSQVGGVGPGDDGLSGTGAPASRADVQLFNATVSERFATVVVTDGGRELAVESRPLPPAQSVLFPGLVAAKGLYRVVVETESGRRGATDWRVRDSTPDLAVDVRPAVQFRRLARCRPDCSPLAIVRTAPGGGRVDGGEASGPDGAGVGGAADATQTPDRPSLRNVLVLDNGGASDRTIAVDLRDGGESVLAGDYRVPGGGRLDLSVPARVQYTLDVAADGRRTTYDWSAATIDRLVVDLATPAPTVRCRDLVRDLIVRNDDDRSTRVAVRIESGGDRAAAVGRTVELSPGGARQFTAAVPSAASYDVLVETDRGLREEYAWPICPPVGPITVAVGATDIAVSVRA